MNELRTRFETGNAAFGDNGSGEASRILHGIAEKVSQGHVEGNICDINGNLVGEWGLEDQTGSTGRWEQPEDEEDEEDEELGGMSDKHTK